jgi:hypothetical protein
MEPLKEGMYKEKQMYFHKICRATEDAFRPVSHWGDAIAIQKRKKVDYRGESSSHRGRAGGRSAITIWMFDQ